MDQYRIDSHKLHLHPARVADWAAGRPIYPVYVEISPSGACNHRCTFCAVDYIGYAMRFLDADLLKVRLTEMAGLGVKSIMYAGEGEPLLHRRLAELLVHGKGVGLDNAITTNAVALTERFAREALPATTWIKASINGGTAADYARIHRARPADWERVWRNLATAVRLREELGATCTLGAQTVLLPDNADGVPQLAERCKAIGLDYLVVKPYSQHLMSPTRTYAGLDYSAHAGLADRLEALDDARFQVVFRRHTMAKLAAPDRGYSRCLATPHFWAYVMASGDVYGCSAYLQDDRFRYGNLQQESFEAIWTGARRQCNQAFVETGLDISECRKNCRMDEVNRYLWELRHPPAHANFI